MNEYEIAAYLDRRVTAAEQERIEGHLAGCGECRQEVIQSHRLLRRIGRPKRLLLIGTLLAAAAVLVVMVRPALVAPGAEVVTPGMRDGGNGSPLVAYGPSGETALTSLHFVWSPASSATTYRLTVSRSDGVPVWSSSTADTALTLPDSVVFRVGDSYFWVVDALLSDGSTRSTGLHEFRPAR
jgi:hypothetical protein